MVTRVIQYFRFPDKPMKSGETSWISRKGGKGILEKRGGGGVVDLEKGDMSLLTNNG